VASLNVNKRESTGKYDAFNLRRAGRIPAVVCAKGRPSVGVSLPLREFRAFLKSGQPLFDLVVDSEPPAKAVLKAIQHGTYDTDILHADFSLVNENETLDISVSIELTGEAAGLAVGGILEHEMRLVTVRCLPKDIPEVIRVDVTALNIGDRIDAEHLPALPNVAYIYHGRPTVVS